MEEIAKENGFNDLEEMIRYYSILLSYENEGNIYNILKQLFKL